MSRSPITEALTRICRRGRPVRLAAAGVVIALTAGAGSAAASAGPPKDPVPAIAAPRPPSAALTPVKRAKTSSHTVTLPTGDRFRVVVGPDGAQTADPVARKGTGGAFTRFVFRGDTYVIPAAAAPYLGTTLDWTLFDVGYLVRAKLDDAHTASLPVRVTATRATAEALPATSVTSGSGRAAKAEITKRDAGGLGRLLAKRWHDGTLSGVDRIELAAPAGTPKPPAAPTTAATTAAKGTRFHTLTVGGIDRDGKPGVAIGFVHNVDDGSLFSAGLAWPGEGKKAFVVPEGTYSVELAIFGAPRNDVMSSGSFVAQPEVKVARDTTVTLDARTAVPYRANLESPPSPDMSRIDLFTYLRTSAAGDRTGIAPSSPLGALTMGLISWPANKNSGLYAAPTKAVTKGRFDFTPMTTMTAGNPSSLGSDSTYELVFPAAGTVPASLTYTVKAADLTTVHASLYDSVSDDASPGPLNRFHRVYLPSGWSQFGYGDLPAAGDRTDYIYSSSPDQVVWQSIVGPDRGERLEGRRMTVRPGQVINEEWNKGPDVPSPAATYVQRAQPGFLDSSDTQVDRPFLQVCGMCRQGDLGMAYIQTAGDSDPLHFTEQSTDKSVLEFYRNGTLAYTDRQSAFGPAPLGLPMLPGPADYRLTWTFSHEATSYSPSSTDWRFRSAASDPAAPLPKDVQCVDTTRGCSFLPLLFVNYDLALDHGSRAPAGKPFDVAFRVSHQEHQAAPAGVAATVEVSYDNGGTWSAPKDAERRADGTYAASITHPEYTDAGRWVSLRVKAHDADGSTVTQTNIRAYRLTS
ncbi:hypothetical protein [Actinomadura sp. GTD37]|uniref:hypothetical protein n=1 Tax=Actinomadura sp. GTD37 TaxID=1778030 RepID=UPI0035C15874